MGLFDLEEDEVKYGDKINRDVSSELGAISEDLNAKIKSKIEARLETEKQNHPDQADDLVIADPDVEKQNALFSAWLISEKKMSPADAFKFGKGSENYEAFADEYAQFIADSSVLANDFTGETISAKPGAIAKILKDANEAMKTYTTPVFDVYDLAQGKDAMLVATGAKDLTAEIAKQVSVMHDMPYRMKSINSEVADKFGNYDLKGEASALDTFTGEAVPNDAKREKVMALSIDLEKRKNYAFDMSSITTDLYFSGYSYTPVRMLVLREKAKDFMGKTLEETKADKIQFDEVVVKTSNDIMESTAMKNISEGRMMDRLLGKKDDEIDEIVSVKGAAKISVAKVKVTSTKALDSAAKNSPDKVAFTKKINQMKEKQRKAAGHDFKLRSEVVGNDIKSAIDGIQANEENANYIEQLKQIASVLASNDTVIKQMDVPVTYRYKDVAIEGVKKTLLYHNNAENGALETDDYFQHLVDGNEQIKQAIDNIKENNEYDKLPQNVKDIIVAAENVYNYDKHFYEWIEELPLHNMGIDEVKTNYVKTFAFVKHENKQIESEMQAAKGNAVEPFTIGKLNSIVKNNGTVKAADVANIELLDGDLNEGRIGEMFNAKQYIEELQRGIDLNQNNMTFDDFAKLLAVRNLADAKRNSFLGGSLNKDVSKEEFDVMLDEFKNEPAVKTAFQYAKVNPKRWENLNKAFKTGHGGGIEDYFKTTLKVANFEDIPQSDTFARYRPTVKEKIEFTQELVNNGSDRLTSATIDILVCRNVAGAESNNKAKLDFAMSGEFLKKAVQQEKVLKEHKAYNKMIREMDRDEMRKLITQGHGGAMSERIRQESDKGYMKGEKEVNGVLWQNTVKGMMDRINAQFAEIKNDVEKIAANEFDVDELKRQNAIEEDFEYELNLDALKPDVNIAMKRNVARAVVINDMYNEKLHGSKNEFASDFSDRDFINRVDKLMETPDFGRVYSEMMKRENQVELTVENVNNKYHEIKQQMGLEPKPKAKQNEAQKEQQAPAMH